MTLIELVVVIAILVVLAAGMVPLFNHAADSAQSQAATATMRAVQEAIVGTPGSPGYFDDLGAMPRPNLGVEPGRVDHPQLRYLFINPASASAVPNFDPRTRRGWRGPYLVSSTGTYAVDDVDGFTRDFGETGDPSPCDPWGKPLVIQQAVVNGLTVWQLTSAGPDGNLTTTSDNLTLDLQSASP